MKQKKLAALAAAGALALAAGAANAATFTVDLQGSSFPQPSVVINDAGGSGLDLTITASDYNNSNGTPTGGPFSVGQYNQGIGVCSGSVTNSGDGCSGDEHYLDGLGGDEMAFFDWSDEVTLTAITFWIPNLVNGPNEDPEFDFALYSGEDAPLWFSQVDIGTNGSGVRTYTLGTPRTGDFFGIGASGYDDDYFKIKKLTFDYVAPIPLPAAGWMLLAGIGGIAAMKRRKKAAA